MPSEASLVTGGDGSLWRLSKASIPPAFTMAALLPQLFRETSGDWGKIEIFVWPDSDNLSVRFTPGDVVPGNRIEVEGVVTFTVRAPVDIQEQLILFGEPAYESLVNIAPHKPAEVKLWPK